MLRFVNMIFPAKRPIFLSDSFLVISVAIQTALMPSSNFPRVASSGKLFQFSTGIQPSMPLIHVAGSVKSLKIKVSFSCAWRNKSFNLDFVATIDRVGLCRIQITVAPNVKPG
jgi:hypothetical protein